jgi:hypothetical protein
VLDPLNNMGRVTSAAIRAVKEALPAHDIDLDPATTVTMARDDKPK